MSAEEMTTPTHTYWQSEPSGVDTNTPGNIGGPDIESQPIDDYEGAVFN